MLKKFVIAAGALFIAIVVLVGIGASVSIPNTAVHQTPTSRSAIGSGAPTTRPPSSTRLATLGDTLQAGSSVVTLDSVTEPAVHLDEFNTPDAGNKLVTIEVTIKDSGSSAISDDADLNLAVVGSDGQLYSPDFNSARGCQDFNGGSYTLAPGDTLSGCVVFQLPVSVKVSKVQFTPSGGFGQTMDEWTLSPAR